MTTEQFKSKNFGGDYSYNETISMINTYTKIVGQEENSDCPCKKEYLNSLSDCYVRLNSLQELSKDFNIIL